MDKRTLRQLVTDLKEQNPRMPYEEIANILANEYGVKMSRQAVYGMHQRALANVRGAMENKEKVVVYVCNLHVYGYSPKEIIAAVKRDLKCEISEFNVQQILEQNDKYLADIRKDISEAALEKVRLNREPSMIRFGDYRINRDTVRDIIIDTLASDLMVDVTLKEKVLHNKPGWGKLLKKRLVDELNENISKDDSEESLEVEEVTEE